MEAPELALWRAVVNQAMKDGLKKPSSHHSKNSSANLEQQRSISWFTNQGGNFCAVCEMANLDPTFVRAEFIKKYKEKFNADPV